MNFGPFMAEISAGKIHRVYLLAGEEHYFIQKALEKILSSVLKSPGERQDGLMRYAGDISVDEMISAISSAPFFVEKNVVLISQTKLFKEKGGEGAEKATARLIEAIAEMSEDSVLIFTSYEKVDKRRKLYKAVEKYGAVLEADPIRAWNIGDWLSGKLQAIHKELDREAYAYFMEMVGMVQQLSLAYFDQEFDKLALYTQEKKVTRADLEAVFSSLPEVSSFALIDAISERNAKKAIALFQRQTADGVYLPLLVSILVRHARQLYQARLYMAQGVKGKALAKPLELNPFIAEKLGRAADGFSDQVLENSLIALADADYFLKTGQGGAELLEDVILRLTRGENRH